jgi:cytochrome c biogenesis protein CcdA
MSTKDAVAIRRARVRFAATALGVVIVGIAGYLGFLAFAGADGNVGTGVVVLGATTGFAAFFSPCSFPLMLTFLARRSAESKKVAFLSALRVGAGAAVMLAVLAAIVAGGGTALASVVTFDTVAGRIFRFTIGATLVVVGLRQARLLNFRMPWTDRIAGTAGTMFDPSKISGTGRSDFVYGFGYLLAGFG